MENCDNFDDINQTKIWLFCVRVFIGFLGLRDAYQNSSKCFNYAFFSSNKWEWDQRRIATILA